MDFEIRNLAARDVAPMCRIISKIGLSEFKDAIPSETINSVFKENGDEEGDEAVAVGISVVVSIADIVFRNIDKVEKDLFTWLASVSGLTPEEVSSLSLADFATLIGAVFKSEDFNDFFTAVRALL